MLNQYGYPSEISIAYFDNRQYLGNDSKGFNAWFVSYHKNKKDVYNFVTQFYSHR